MKALLVIDVQKSYVRRYDPELISKINKRIVEAQKENYEIIYVKNIKMLRSGPVVDDLSDNLILASSQMFSKTKADAFTSEAVVTYLKSQGITEVEIIGIDGNSCIKATAIGGVKKGFTEKQP